MKEPISIRQFRIGNIVSYDGNPYYVSYLSLDIDDEHQDLIGVTEIGKIMNEVSGWNREEVIYNHLDLLPLTDDWLIKLGFTYANENGQKFYWHIGLPYFNVKKDDDGKWLMYYR